MTEDKKPSGPDLTKGVSLSEFKDSKLLGHVGEEDVLLVQAGSEIFAIEPSCSHYHGPLAEGLVVGDTIRCPWHHACFSLRTGEATRPPALNALAVWDVTRDRDKIIVQRKREAPKPSMAHRSAPTPEKFVIVGGGAAGFAAAETLRREGFAGAITMLSSDGAMPVDRPNLSKDYLAGNAPEDWMPLRGEDYYQDAGIDLRLNTNVSAIDPKTRSVTLGNGDKLAVRPPAARDRRRAGQAPDPRRRSAACPHLALGRRQPRHHQGRRQREARAGDRRELHRPRGRGVACARASSRCTWSRRRSGRCRRVLGPEMGDFVRELHEENGVNFHLKDTVEKLDGTRATLKSGAVIEADLVVVGIGVKPRLALAEQAGLAIDRGVSVERISRDQRRRHLRRRRHRALARSAFAADHPRRALGGRGAAGPDRGAQHARQARALRRRAVLLEPALRRADQLCRPRREL